MVYEHYGVLASCLLSAYEVNISPIFSERHMLILILDVDVCTVSSQRDRVQGSVQDHGALDDADNAEHRVRPSCQRGQPALPAPAHVAHAAQERTAEKAVIQD